MGWNKIQQYPRIKVQLPIRCILRSIEGNFEEPVNAPSIVTQTHDLSASGLSLFVPSLPFVFAYLLSPDNTIKLALELPSGTVLILATLIHDRPIAERGDFPGYVITGLAEPELLSESLSRQSHEAVQSAWLVGLQIKEMSDTGREKYLAFIKTLS